MYKTGKISIILLFILSLYCSCDSKLSYESFQKVDVQGWNYKDNLSFTVPIKKEEENTITIALRNTSDYEKSNLWLFIEISSPSGKRTLDTLDCTLADDYGYWLGSGFSGLYLTQHKLAKPIHWNEIGDWKIKVIHGMREDTIKGIQEVGILVTKNK